jgi:mediator of replication checkpoint protein 1
VIEKHVTDAVEGKHRTKRRDRGIGFEDSDSESEDDNKPRGPKRQKRQVEGDTLDALRTCLSEQQHSMTSNCYDSTGALPKAAPFVEVYEAALKDDDDDLAFLSKVDSHVQLDDRPSITYDRADADDDDDEEQTELTAAEAREQMRILAVNAQVGC